MKKILLFVVFSIAYTNAESQNTLDSIDIKIDDYSFLFVGTSASMIHLLGNLNASIGYNLYTNKDAIVAEYEMGRIFSVKDDWLFRFSIKYYPRILYKRRHALVIGAGVQSYRFTKSNNGIFSRFDDNYRQEIDFKVQTHKRNIFGLVGVQDIISEQFFYEVHAIIGHGDQFNETTNIPQDAEYLGSGRAFGPSQLPEKHIQRAFINYKFLITYRF